MIGLSQWFLLLIALAEAEDYLGVGCQTQIGQLLTVHMWFAIVHEAMANLEAWTRLSLHKERKYYAAAVGTVVLVQCVALGEDAAIDHHAKLYQQGISSVALSVSRQPFLIAAIFEQPLVGQLCGETSLSCRCIELCPVLLKLIR